MDHAGDPAAVGDLPGTGGGRRAVVRTRSVALAPTGRSWAAATTGLFSCHQRATARCLAESVTLSCMPRSHVHNRV